MNCYFITYILFNNNKLYFTFKYDYRLHARSNGVVCETPGQLHHPSSQRPLPEKAALKEWTFTEESGRTEVGYGAWNDWMRPHRDSLSRKQNNVPVDIVPGERPVRLAPGRESERLEQKKAVHFERPCVLVGARGFEPPTTCTQYRLVSLNKNISSRYG